MKLQKIFLTLLLSCSLAAIADKPKSFSQPVTPSKNIQQVASSFDNDDLFSEQADMFQQMEVMQHAMNRLINNHLLKQNQSLGTKPKQYSQTALKDVVISEKGDVLTYKIKLPTSQKNRVQINAENNQLKIIINFEQKITKENGNSKSIHYSHNSQTQSFKLPTQYQEKTMTSKIEGDELTVSFTKKHSSIT